MTAIVELLKIMITVVVFFSVVILFQLLLFWLLGLLLGAT